MNNKHYFQCALSLFMAALAIACMNPAAFGQEIISGKGDRFIPGEKNDISIENPFSDASVLTLTSPKGAGLVASATIVQGTRVTRCSAKKITYKQLDGAFLLDGNALIHMEDSTLRGPVKIENNTKKNSITAFGTSKTPATLKYNTPSGPKKTPNIVQGKKITFLFNDGGGLINILIEENHGSELLIDQKKTSKKSNKLIPKLSN